MKNKSTIFIVEDDLISVEYLKNILLQQNYEILGIVDSAEEAIKQCTLLKPDIILMDIVLKGRLNGVDAAIKIKDMHYKCKIIFLTAYASPELINFASKTNAYAYLMKPYRKKEILATISIILNQDNINEEQNNNRVLLKDDFYFDFSTRHLYKNNIEIPLNEQKTNLIELLAKNKNTVVSNEQISMCIWGEIKSTSTLRSLIYRIRSIVDDNIILNINGIGYKI